MAKEKPSVIALEIEKYEKKIFEFQTYLETNDVRRIGELEDDGQDKYKEMDIQMKIMNVLPNWLISLKNLKEESATKTVELRGGNQINDAVRLMKERKANELSY